MKTCTECGGELPLCHIPNTHHAMATCIRNLQLRVEKSEAVAIEMAKNLVSRTSGEVWQEMKPYEDWLYVKVFDGKRAVEYLAGVGLLEMHPERDWFRWKQPEGDVK